MLSGELIVLGGYSCVDNCSDEVFISWRSRELVVLIQEAKITHWIIGRYVVISLAGNNCLWSSGF